NGAGGGEGVGPSGRRSAREPYNSTQRNRGAAIRPPAPMHYIGAEGRHPRYLSAPGSRSRSGTCEGRDRHLFFLARHRQLRARNQIRCYLTGTSSNPSRGKAPKITGEHLNPSDGPFLDCDSRTSLETALWMSSETGPSSGYFP